MKLYHLEVSDLEKVTIDLINHPDYPCKMALVEISGNGRIENLVTWGVVSEDSFARILDFATVTQ